MAKRKIQSDVKVSQHPVGYEGNVTIKTLRKGAVVNVEKINNAGTLLLFDGIAKFLSGLFKSDFNISMDTYLPKYLGIGDAPNASATNLLMYSLEKELDIGERIRLNVGNVKVDSTANCVILPVTALITYETLSGKFITELGLFGSSTPLEPTMLARIVLNDRKSLTPGETWVIEWDIKIQNR